MVLIYPPGARSTEAPIGLGRLAGYLQAQGRGFSLLDLGQEGLDYLLAQEPRAVPGDTWSILALRRRERHSSLLKSPRAAQNFDAYSKAVRDLNKALKAGSPQGIEPGLADYRETLRSPQSRKDLLDAAASWETSVFAGLYEKRLGEVLPGCEDKTLGISLTFLSQALPSFALLGCIKSRYPEFKVVLGGGLVTSWLAQGSLSPEESFGGLVDGLVYGRGEEGLGTFLGLPAVRGFFPPRFDGLKLEGYFSPGPVLPWNFSSGCPWKKCAFCPELAEDQAYRGSPAPQALTQVRHAVEDWTRAGHQPALIHFTDSEISPLYLRALAAHPPGAPWYGFARFSPLLGDPAFCSALRASGCVMLQLGLESGDQAVLDAMGKGTNLGDIDRAIVALSEAGIGLYVYLLFGTPKEDRAAALRTRDFVAARAKSIDYLNLAIFNMPLASPEAALYGRGSFYPGDYSLYCEFSHPLGWNRDEVRLFLAKDFEAEASLRPLVQRNPPVYTSSHAPFFLMAARGP